MSHCNFSNQPGTSVGPGCMRSELEGCITTLEAKLAERDREVEGMEMAAKGDADLIALLRKQVDWCRQHMAYEPEPDWSEVMKEHHALTTEEKPHG